MDRLELPVIKGTVVPITSIVISLMGTVAYALRAMQLSPTETLFGILLRAFIVAVSIWFVTVIGLEILAKKRTYLFASHPPAFVTEKTWFCKLSRTNKQILDGAAWVRVTCQNPKYDTPLRIEIGTRGYITTMVHARRYSEKDISICKEICSQVAHFLKLEDRGYVYYDNNGVPHAG